MIAALFGPGRTLFLPFMTAGLPNPAASPSLFAAMAEAGADGFEVGIPYSDPLMDGPVIQRGSDAALAAGTSLGVAFETMRHIADTTQRPLLAMTYANPLLRLGADVFCRRLKDAGAEGVIVPDLPLEESGEVAEAAERHRIGMVHFVAPTTGEDRIRRVAAAGPLFIYGVADLGVTGERTGVSTHVADLSRRVRAITDLPLVLGVGISTPDQAAVVAPYADGVIVGSALVRLVLESDSADEAIDRVSRTVGLFRAALDGVNTP
ncbi:MAG TPA: tryptophan synthase subunit alpha [Acidimicrobiia bacterium]|nr:tryptophan synthase subunit alpha [Acidimicrobiia bacterium]